MSSSSSSSSTAESASFWDELEGEISVGPKFDQATIARVQKQIYEKNEYQFIEVKTRNVLLVGRTRSGKSTTMGVLKDPCYVPKTDTIFSETVEPTFRSFSLHSEAEHLTRDITLNIVDTPGLFEIKDLSAKEDERTNEAIAQTISRCLEHEITHVHVIVMFATFEAGINKEDIKAMEIFLGMFGGCNIKIALCITHADKHDQEWQDTRKKELMNYPAMKDLIEKEHMEIIFMGCAGKNYVGIETEKALLQVHQKIYLMRRKMLKMIFDSEQRVQLVDTKVAKNKIKALEILIDKTIENFKVFNGADDMAVAHISERILKQKEISQLMDKDRTLLSAPELSHKFSQMLVLIKHFAARKDIADRDLVRAVTSPFHTDK
eukprot:c10504_g1_i1.p1 GENE.c10504_g1_i1~~c10504_g1_i1.p1  ORF type:complete len:377 (+),score=25.65 c10504_g1_i1:56-1186(+)